jgi:hypothetical protein
VPLERVIFITPFPSDEALISFESLDLVAQGVCLFGIAAGETNLLSDLLHRQVDARLV